MNILPIIEKLTPFAIGLQVNRSTKLNPKIFIQNTLSILKKKKETHHKPHIQCITDWIERENKKKEGRTVEFRRSIGAARLIVLVSPRIT